MSQTISTAAVPGRPSAHAHRQVARTAKALAAEMYDKFMHDDALAAAWRAKNPGATPRELELRFVRRNLAKCLPVARAIMAQILVTSSDDALKRSIHEALVLDRSLIRGRTP